jgi:hypothetical protein
VEHYGENEWVSVAAEIPGRTALQCRDRYKNYLSVSTETFPWTLLDDHLLMQTFAEIGCCSTQMAKFFTNRNNVNNKNRWTLFVTREEAPSPAKPVTAVDFSIPTYVDSDRAEPFQNDDAWK